MQRGVPVYFVAEATLYRSRWYWRDERVARVQRSWRVAYQPLTSTWRVGFGGFNQSFPTPGRGAGGGVAQLALEARRADAARPRSRHYLEFSYRLDNSQLPSPMQLGLGSRLVLGLACWASSGTPDRMAARR